MKKLLLILTILLIGYNASANSLFKSTTGDPEILKEKAIIELNYKDGIYKEDYLINFETIQSFKNYDIIQIPEITGIDLNSDDCEMSVTITVSVTVSGGVGVVGGEVTTSVSTTVTASCSEIKAELKKAKETLLDAIK